MSITLHWWMVPAGLAGLGLFLGRSQGTWDFVSPLIGMACFGMALAVIVGHVL